MIRREVQIEAPQSVVFDVVSDLRSYPEFISGTKSVQVFPQDERQLEAEFSVKVIKEISYRLRFELHPPSGLSWSLVEGDYMKKNSGSWTLKAVSDAECLAIYEIDIEFGFLVPKKLVEGLTTVQLPDLMQAFKSRAESKAKMMRGNA